VTNLEFGPVRPVSMLLEILDLVNSNRKSVRRKHPQNRRRGFTGPERRNDGQAQRKGAFKCLVCSHKDRNAIEKAVLDGESLRNISKQFGPSPPTPCRHKSHIAQALALASEHRGIVLGESLLQKLDRMELDFARQRAELQGELPSAIIVLREVRETLKVIHKMRRR
jgi:hypothetical protein